jgi:hypothetical protein
MCGAQRCSRDRGFTWAFTLNPLFSSFAGSRLSWRMLSVAFFFNLSERDRAIRAKLDCLLSSLAQHLIRFLGGDDGNAFFRQS